MTVERNNKRRRMKVTVTNIKMYEQVGIGNFAGDTNDEQMNAAYNFARILTEKMRVYCANNYPDAKIEIDFDVDNVSGCTNHFESFVDCTVENDDEFGSAASSFSHEIENTIKYEYESICAKLEQSGEIYK